MPALPLPGLQFSSGFFFFFFNFIATLFISLFLALLGLRFVRGPSLVTASGGHSSSRCRDRSSSRCVGLSLSRPLPLRGTGSRRAGSAAVAHGPSRSAARGILPDQGSNPCPLHQQADSQPLRHQGSPLLGFISLPVADQPKEIGKGIEPGIPGLAHL